MEVAEPGGEGEGGSGGLVAAHGEAVDVGAEERDLGEGKGEGANLLGAQAVLKSVKVALGCASAGSFAAPSTGLRTGSRHGYEPPFDRLRTGTGHGRGKPPPGRGRRQGGASTAPTGVCPTGV